MSTTDDRKYVSMEAVLHAINRSYISLAEDHIKQNNPIIKYIIEEKLITRMKEQCPLFELMYTNIFYGGSFYDGLKVGKPEEYDLDLLISLPKIANPVFIESDVPGYVYVQMPLIDKLRKQPEGSKYSVLDKLIDGNNFILTTKFRSWLEGIIKKTLNSFDQEGKCAVVVIKDKGVPLKFSIKIIKSGPAFTLKITDAENEKNLFMDVDIVPVIKCSKWPDCNDYRRNPSKKTDFFVVPKGPTRDELSEKYWRLSFQEQERDLINGYNHLKPVIRLLKRLRDFQKQDVIASYYIKTIFLLTLDNVQISKSWCMDSLSCCFMKGLELYENHLRNYSIPFYWNPKLNLLINTKEETCTGFANKIRKILNDIKAKVECDPFIVAKYLLSSDDTESLKSSVNLGAKVERRIFTSQLLQSANISSTSSTASETSVEYEAKGKDDVIMDPMEKLNYEIFKNAFDDVNNCATSAINATKNDTLNDILIEMRSMNARLTRIEEKVDKIWKRVEKLENEELNSFSNLNLIKNVFQSSL